MKSRRLKMICFMCSAIMGTTLMMGNAYGDPAVITNPIFGTPKGVIQNGSVEIDYFLNSEQNTLFKNINEDISADRIYETIDELASDKYLGRLTGSKGNELATEYLRVEYEKLGLVPFDGEETLLVPYTQKIFSLEEAPTIKIIDKKGEVVDEVQYLKDFSTYALPHLKLNGTVKGDILQINTPKDLKKANYDLKGKILFVSNEMKNDELLSQLAYSEGNTPLAWITNIGDITGREEFRKPVHMPQYEAGIPEDMKLMLAMCDSKGAEVIQKAINNGNQLELSIKYKVKEKIVNNVVGMIPGSDEELKDEYILITGHFDHLGDNFDGRYNPGASDNASGTASVLEIARSLKENGINPKRPLVFIAFNGEENGLLGSKALMGKLHEEGVDLSKIEMLNIDMIANKIDSSLHLGAMGKTDMLKDLKRISVEMGMNTKLDVGKPFSDHASLEEFGGEAVSFCEYDQEEYHTPADTIDVIDKEDLSEVVELVLRYLSSKI